MDTSAFKDWFNRKYNDWVQAQPGEEDFLAFCDLLGYPPAKVNEWLDGIMLPDSLEVLNIAGVFGKDAYKILGVAQPDQELLDIYVSFPQLSGELRSRLTQAIWECQINLKDAHLSANSKEAKELIRRTLVKWGFRSS